MRFIGLISLALCISGCQPSCSAAVDIGPPPFFLSKCTTAFLRAEHEAKRLPYCVAADLRGMTAYTLETQAGQEAAQ